MTNNYFDTIKEKYESKGYKVEEDIINAEWLKQNLEIEKIQRRALKILIPEKRGTRLIYIPENEELNNFIENQLEEFKFLQGYNAIWSPELKIIECEIQNSEESEFYLVEKYSDRQRKHKTFHFPSVKEDVNFFLGDASEQFSTLNRLQRRNKNSRCRTLRIEGIKIDSHDIALATLIKISNAVLFQFDIKAGYPMRLEQTAYEYFNGLYFNDADIQNSEFSETKFEYDREAVSLYMYARLSAEMPLLQYLAFYQVLEFYFPVYSYKDAQQKLKNYIKSPLFDVNKDSDISGLLNIIKTSGKGKSFGDERSQIKATLENIIDEETLLKYFNGSVQRKDYFDISKKSKSLAKQKIDFRSQDTNIRSQVALRIYEIRCRVVHLRGDENVELLLPYSEEVVGMHEDLDLVKFIAQRAIISGSRPLAW